MYFYIHCLYLLFYWSDNSCFFGLLELEKGRNFIFSKILYPILCITIVIVCIYSSKSTILEFGQNYNVLIDFYCFNFAGHLAINFDINSAKKKLPKETFCICSTKYLQFMHNIVFHDAIVVPQYYSTIKYNTYYKTCEFA